MGVAVSVVLLSGGLDSLIMLATLVEQGAEPECMTFVYGQRHEKEVAYAARSAARYARPHRVIDISNAIPSCQMTGSEAIKAGATMIVPNRNAVMIAVAAAYAAGHDYKAVYIGCHGGDRAVYVDCRKAFIDRMCDCMVLSCGVRVVAPFVEMPRSQVVLRGRELGVSFDDAWSCYAGGETPCGVCGACVSRSEAGA